MAKLAIGTSLSNVVPALFNVITPVLVTKTITQNGIYTASDDNADGYSSVTVNLPNVPDYYITKTSTTVTGGKKLGKSTSFIDLTGIVDLDSYSLTYSYWYSNITTADMSSLTKISGNYACQDMFNNCTSLTSCDLSGVTTISGACACQNMFYSASHLTSCDLSGLVTISGQQACQNMFTNATLSSVKLNSLTTISGYQACRQMFYTAGQLGAVDLSSLTTISGEEGCYQMFSNNCTSCDLSGLITATGRNACYRMFYGCTRLQSIDFSNLTTIGYRCFLEAFYNCTGLTVVRFPKLASFTDSQCFYDAFQKCTGLTDVYFPALIHPDLTTDPYYTSKFEMMLYQCNGVTVHLPANFTDVFTTNVFDGTNTTILFDLPSTAA